MKPLAPTHRSEPRARATALLGGSRLAGFTMLELLLVMLILGILFGVGTGALASLDLSKRAAKGSVQNAIRAARTSAVARGASARVRFDAKANRLSSEGVAVLGTWQFESERGEDSTLAGENKGGKFLDDGYIGRAISFAGAPSGSTFEIPTQTDAGFDLSRGFVIDCALRVELKGSGRALNFGNVIGLEVTSARSVRAWFVPTAVDRTRREIPGGRTSAESAPGAFELDHWVRARVEYDRRSLRLLLDDVEVARTEEEGAVWHAEGSLKVCDPQTGFPGSIDHLVVAAVTSTSELQLGESVHFDSDAPAEIRFAPGGYLDRELHDAPIVFHLVDLEGKRDEIRVGLYGTVE